MLPHGVHSYTQSINFTFALKSSRIRQNSCRDFWEYVQKKKKPVPSKLPTCLLKIKSSGKFCSFWCDR